ncbi:organic hydroperoxide resistance protein [Kurthia sibirica]|uniref:Osmotically inducible protein C n=1 Tax=Kurthia sibirica TaxID=202750 RepID=A0A2U3APH7_9BACL|nr:organic hydroperoxide resistance protein [Kurthia sibirica]PWI26419.1 osmotically inducible protein C [Kurthia sibirica]GEK32983.1 osmotically inducible protein C [Kurthia sibirica]
MTVLYETTIINTGGRKGQVYSEDKSFDMEVAAPGSKSTATNPEQLFAAGYSACFNSALEVVMRGEKIKSKSTVKGTVSLLKDEADNGFKIAVQLEVEIADLDQAETERLAKIAHTVCPYSKATAGNIDVTIKAI